MEHRSRNSFNQLKSLLTTIRTLAYLDFQKYSHLYTDALDIVLGVILMQLNSRKKEQPLAYASRTLQQVEQSYSTTRKEALAVVWTLRHFKDHICGYPIHVKTDHTAVVELFNSKHLTDNLARQSLIVQYFNPSFSYLPGKANVVADALFRYIGTLQISGGEEFQSASIQLQMEDSFSSPLLYHLE